MKTYGHWQFPYEFDPSEWFGFVYRIIEKDTGKQYIGKKKFRSTLRKKVKNRKNRKVIIKDTNWKEYTGSSRRLNEEIEIRSLENYEFKIESLHKTQASLSYGEVRLQVLEDVLRAKDPKGEKLYYNAQIGSVKYIPPDETDEESKMKYPFDQWKKDRNYKDPHV